MSQIRSGRQFAEVLGCSESTLRELLAREDWPVPRRQPPWSMMDAAKVRNWRAEFEGYHREGLCWTTILHPKVCAKPGRLSILEGLFKAIASKGDSLWTARLGDIALWWIERHSPTDELAA